MGSMGSCVSILSVIEVNNYFLWGLSGPMGLCDSMGLSILIPCEGICHLINFYNMSGAMRLNGAIR